MIALFTPLIATAGIENDRPELQVLLCCAHTCVNQKAAEKIKLLLSEGINWGHLIEISRRHGMIPLLYHNLNTICPESVPENILQQLRDFFQVNAQRNLFYTHELIKLLHFIGTHNITAVPFKGPVLAASAYGNLAWRSFGDLDIWVHKRDVPKISDLLISQGYQLHEDHGFENDFHHPLSGISIDLHHALAPRLFSFSIDFDEVRSRLKPFKLAGATISQLSPEDLLLVLCVLWGRDCYLWRMRLTQLCDINELLRAYPELNWSQVLEQARKLRGERLLLIALASASNLLETSLPDAVHHKLQADPIANSLAAQISSQFLDSINTSSEDSINTFDSSPQIYKHNFLKMREHWLDGLPYFLHRALIPREQEVALLPQPQLAFLRYPLRILRLIRKYGVKLLYSVS
jgi:hypothetical protein